MTAEEMREAAATALRRLRISGGDCAGTGSVDIEAGFAECGLGDCCLCAHFNHAIEECLAEIRAILVPEAAPDSRDATIARLSADVEAAREALAEIVRVADEGTVPDRHGRQISGCSLTLLNEAETLARAALAKLSAKGA